MPTAVHQGTVSCTYTTEEAAGIPRNRIPTGILPNCAQERPQCCPCTSLLLAAPTSGQRGCLAHLQGDACVWVLVKQSCEKVDQMGADGHLLRQLQGLVGNGLRAADSMQSSRVQEVLLLLVTHNT